MDKSKNLDQPSEANEYEDRWQFAFEFYQSKGVERLLLEAQDIYRCDVILVVYSLYLARSYYKLNPKLWESAQNAHIKWQQEITKPLRLIRRELKKSPHSEVQTFREDIKAIELQAEKLALHSLPPMVEVACQQNLLDDSITKTQLLSMIASHNLDVTSPTLPMKMKTLLIKALENWILDQPARIGQAQKAKSQ